MQIMNIFGAQSVRVENLCASMWLTAVLTLLLFIFHVSCVVSMIAS